MATIGAILKLIFPNGTATPPEKGRSKGGSLTRIPIYAPDTFAAVATLLDWSGAYQYLWLPQNHELGPDPLRVLSDEARAVHQVMAAAYAYLVPFRHDPEERDALTEAACQFLARRYDRTDVNKEDVVEAGAKLQQLWDAVIRCKNEPVIHFRSPTIERLVPEWWSPALRLLIITDEACGGLGFHSTDKTLIQALAANLVEDRNISEVETFCTGLVNDSVVNVLPKTKTSQVGCTMPALTHNLAALQRQGQASARWLLTRAKPLAACPSRAASGPDRGEFLNLLLVPFPYRIPSRCFEESPSKTFMTKQCWLDTTKQPGRGADALAQFVKALCHICSIGGVPIHGVVFPEYSLDWHTYDRICGQLLEAFPQDIELVIAGVSHKPEAQHPTGNYVAMRGRLRTEDGALHNTTGWDYQSTRGKHHRWKLNDAQMKRYGLSHRFKRYTDAWEDIEIGRRFIEFVEPRAGTSLTTLICEDLARIDPCQQVIRAVGPNLVIALLMDGPQIVTRWPRHYAGVLADDPGSSVLTLSSLGLIERASPTDRTRSRAVAFWKDPGGEVELHLASGNHALAVSLRARRTEEFTLDGRGDGGRSYTWELSQAQSVRAPAEDAPPWILQGAGEF
jgi:hypothetical protein